MKKEAIAAFDLGASSGRLILGTLEDGKLNIEVIHRFKNGPVKLNDSLYLDFLYLFNEMKIGLKKVSERKDVEIRGIGIDTWGVDYAWIDKKGNLFNNPFHYRDSRTTEIIDEVHSIISEDELYSETGIQHFPFNTIYQIYHDIKVNRVLDKGADQFLLMPNLFEYFLTGNRTWERTIASTGSLLNAQDKNWSSLIFEKLEIPKDIVGDLVDPGTENGTLSKDIQDEVGLGAIPVISVGGHDSASALMGSPLQDDGLFLISGTWSLFGKESDIPYTDRVSKEKGFTNELGYKTTRYLKLLTGLWIIQELKKQWNLEGKSLDFPDIIKLAKGSKVDYFIDPNDERFNFSLNMEKEIKDYCKSTNQGEPETIGQVAKAVYNGITNIYKLALKDMEEITGQKYDFISMVGGGIQDSYLCKLTAEELNIRVEAGPIEASVIGNIVCQMISKGIIKDIKQSRDLIKRSFEIIEYLP